MDEQHDDWIQLKRHMSSIALGQTTAGIATVVIDADGTAVMGVGAVA